MPDIVTHLLSNSVNTIDPGKSSAEFWHSVISLEKLASVEGSRFTSRLKTPTFLFGGGDKTDRKFMWTPTKASGVQQYIR